MEKFNRPTLSDKDLLSPAAATNVLSEASLALLHSGIVDPLRGVAQILDQGTGKYLRLEDGIKSATRSLGFEPVQPAESLTLSWYAQQLGSAAGMLAPYLIARTVVNQGANKLFGDKVMSAIHHEGRLASIGSSQTAKYAASEAAASGLAGFTYGMIFVPSERSHDTQASLLKDRVNQALYDAATFAAIGAIGPYIGKGMRSIANAVDDVSIGKYGKLEPYEVRPELTMFEKTRDKTSNFLRSGVVNGAISGVPIGFAVAEINALKSGEWLPGSNQLKESISSMILVGGALGAANRFAAPKKPPMDLKNTPTYYGRSPYQYAEHDFLRATAPPWAADYKKSQ